MDFPNGAADCLPRAAAGRQFRDTNVNGLPCSWLLGNAGGTPSAGGLQFVPQSGDGTSEIARLAARGRPVDTPRPCDRLKNRQKGSKIREVLRLITPPTRTRWSPSSGCRPSTSTDGRPAGSAMSRPGRVRGSLMAFRGVRRLGAGHRVGTRVRSRHSQSTFFSARRWRSSALCDGAARDGGRRDQHEGLRGTQLASLSRCGPHHLGRPVNEERAE